MITLTHNSKSGYWLVKNAAGDTLFASLRRPAAEDYIDVMQLEASVSYQNWQMQQDAKFIDNPC